MRLPSDNRQVRHRRHEAPGPEDAGHPRALMPEVVGEVLRLERVSRRVRQADMAAAMGIPQSGLSKLEGGEVVHSFFHLERFADGLRSVAQEKREDDADGEDAPSAPEVWELVRTASLVADALQQRGIDIFWIAPHKVVDHERYVRGKSLREIVRRAWEELDGGDGNP